MLILVGILLVLIYSVSKSHTHNQCNCVTGKANVKCFKCGEDIEEDYIYCPHCKERLKRKCEGCGRMINVSWRQCPYCK